MKKEQNQIAINTGKAILFISLFATGVLVLFGPLYGYLFSRWYVANTDSAAKLGDWVGGVVGTVVSVLGAIAITYVTFNAFKEQIKANNLLKSDSKQRQFEAVLFKYVDYHRENQQRVMSSPRYFLTDLHSSTPGVNDWYSLYFELRASISIVRKTCQEFEIKIFHQEVLSLGYLIFFFGIKGTSIETLKKYTKHLEDTYTDEFWSNLTNKLKFESEFGYFYGHQMKLSQYFRNLYRAYHYIDKYKEIDLDSKKEYANLIRAQLSNHEIGILTLNCLSPLGRKWLDYNYIEKYEIIKNVPTHFVPGLTSQQLGKFFSSIRFDEDSESAAAKIINEMTIDDFGHEDIITTNMRRKNLSLSKPDLLKVFIVNNETRS